jgi:hypothetical protein
MVENLQIYMLHCNQLQMLISISLNDLPDIGDSLAILLSLLIQNNLQCSIDENRLRPPPQP